MHAHELWCCLANYVFMNSTYNCFNYSYGKKCLLINCSIVRISKKLLNALHSMHMVIKNKLLKCHVNSIMLNSIYLKTSWLTKMSIILFYKVVIHYDLIWYGVVWRCSWTSQDGPALWLTCADINHWFSVQYFIVLSLYIHVHINGVG